MSNNTSDDAQSPRPGKGFDAEQFVRSIQGSTFDKLRDQVIALGKIPKFDFPTLPTMNIPTLPPSIDRNVPYIEPLELAIDPRPQIIAENTERMAEHAATQAEAVAELVQLTVASLTLAQQQRESNEKSERFSRGMAWASVAIAGGSLAASIAAVVIAIVLR